MIKRYLLSIFCVFFSVKASAISNCLEEAKYNQAHIQSVETLAIDYLKIDTDIYNSDSEYYQPEGMDQEFESIPIIQSHCKHRISYLSPIDNGVYNGQYFVLFKGRGQSDGSNSYEIDIALYDTQTLRRHIIQLESITFGEGIYSQFNSSLKFDELTFYSEIFKNPNSEREFSDESELLPNKVKSLDYVPLKNGVEKRCVSLGPLKEDDPLLLFEKNEVIYNCQQRFEYKISLSEILSSQKDYTFNSFETPPQSQDADFSPFYTISYIFQDKSSYLDSDDEYEFLSSYGEGYDGSPFFYEGSVEQIFEHYADPYSFIESKDWVVKLNDQPSYMPERASHVKLQLSITKGHVSVQKINLTESDNYMCDDNYKAYYKHDLIVLEYQGAMQECLMGDNRFIIIKKLGTNAKDFVIRGNLLLGGGWDILYVDD